MADWKEAIRRVLYPAYEARMVKALPQDRLPKHIGVMLDGNRRWAKAVGADTAQGHRAGAANIEPLLGWCEETGIEVVTLWLLSTDNLNRPAAELERAARHHRRRRRLARRPAAVAAAPGRRARPAARRDRRRLKEAEEATSDVDGMLVNIAVGYGRRAAEAHVVGTLQDGRERVVWSLEELACVLPQLEQITAAKLAWPGARVQPMTRRGESWAHDWATVDMPELHDVA